MAEKIKALFFDVDGTLLNTTEFIYQAFEHAFRRHEIENISREKLAPLMGTTLERVYEQIVPTMSAAVLSATHREFQRHNPGLVKVFPGMPEALSEFHNLGLKLVAITSRKEHATESLKEAGISNLFDEVLTGSDVQYHKPHPEGILIALERLSLQPSDAVMIGDMPPDIGAGKAAGTRTIGVTWGFLGPAIQQTHPDYVVTTAGELLSLVKTLI